MEASEELFLWMPIFVAAVSCLFVDILGPEARSIPINANQNTESVVQASRITGQLALSSVSVTNTSVQPLHVETVVISCFSIVYVRIVL